MRHVGKAIDVTNFYVMVGETRPAEAKVTPRTPVLRNISAMNVTVDDEACR